MYKKYVHLKTIAIEKSYDELYKTIISTRFQGNSLDIESKNHIKAFLEKIFLLDNIYFTSNLVSHIEVESDISIGAFEECLKFLSDNTKLIFISEIEIYSIENKLVISYSSVYSFTSTGKDIIENTNRVFRLFLIDSFIENDV